MAEPLTEDNAQPVVLLDLPDALLHRILLHPLSLNDLQTVCTVACTCKALQHVAYVCLAQCTHLRPNAGTCTGALQAVLPRCSQSLTTLDLRGCHRWVDDEAAAVVAGVESLVSLLLDHCTRLTEAGVTALGQGRLRNLQVLSLRSVGNVGNGGALAGLLALRDLNMSWCHSVTGHAVTSFAPRLRRLSVHGCDMVGDEVCSALPGVEDLVVAFTRVGDGGLLSLAARSPALRRLVLAAGAYNLWTTGMWTEAGLLEFQRLRPEVTVELVSC